VYIYIHIYIYTYIYICVYITIIRIKILYLFMCVCFYRNLPPLLIRLQQIISLNPWIFMNESLKKIVLKLVVYYHGFHYLVLSCIFVYTCMCILIYLCIFKRIYTYIYIYICIHKNVHLRTCICTCIFLNFRPNRLRVLFHTGIITCLVNLDAPCDSRTSYYSRIAFCTSSIFIIIYVVYFTT
jgi:hypothetical protein